MRYIKYTSKKILDYLPRRFAFIFKQLLFYNFIAFNQKITNEYKLKYFDIIATLFNVHGIPIFQTQ